MRSTSAKTLVSYVRRMNREPLRSPARSLANLEFHHACAQVHEIGRPRMRTAHVRQSHFVNSCAFGSRMPYSRSCSANCSTVCDDLRTLRAAHGVDLLSAFSFILLAGLSLSRVRWK